ncbi:MAG: hypothetical protein ACI9RV_001796 [Glaciecola sp.]|jgi:hypothetical protein
MFRAKRIIPHGCNSLNNARSLSLNWVDLHPTMTLVGTAFTP